MAHFRRLGHVLNLVRWPNLLIVGLVQYYLYFHHLAPCLETTGLPRSASSLVVALFIIATILIAACGNIINDFIDQDADAINCPSRMIFGKHISEKSGLKIFLLLASCGMLISIYLAYVQSKWSYLPLYPLSLLILVWYSKKLKGLPLIGNLLISIFCSGVFGVVLLLESAHIVDLYQDVLAEKFWRIFIGFGVFAFLTTWAREMVKDAEDLQGDQDTGLNTLAIILGFEDSKKVVLGLLGLLCIGLSFWIRSTVAYGIIPLALSLLMLGLSIYVMIVTWRHWSEASTARISGQLKGLMLLGIIYLMIV